MCDTFVALPPATSGKTVILGKSADCRTNEAHALVHVPRRKHVDGEYVLATHILIPQVRETYEIIISKSFWTWGGEIGINEFGVSIGNEAVFTTVMKEEKQDGLITMDLLRLGLERARTAREAVELMGNLVHHFGQGGNCELPGNSHWDSSYLISDTQEAWVLETAGREWAAKKSGPVASISNAFTIGKDWDLCSLSASQPNLDWGGAFADLAPVPAMGSVERQTTTCDFLKGIGGGSIGIRQAFDLLRTHGDGYHPATAKIHAICMHSGPGEMRLWNACGAMASEVSPDGILGWFTGTSGTCVSIFKPIFLGVDLPDTGTYPIETFDPKAMWWQGELLHRRAMMDFDHVVPEIRKDFEALEDDFMTQSRAVMKGSAKEKKEFMDACFHKAKEATEQWTRRLAGRKDLKFADENFHSTWEKFNREAGLAELLD
jgi:dipeptidase